MSGAEDWIGRSEERRDVIAPFPAQALHATLDLPGDPPEEGEPLPPFWRWLYFLEAAPRARLGRDGHPEKGHGLIPPLDLPRRMWAGGRLRLHRELPIGARATRVSTLADMRRKQGRSGPLAFVTVRHELMTRDGLVETEEQDIVYRKDPEPDAPAPEPRPARRDESFSRAWAVDPTVLFRYSALTFNGHRIHYDLDYCRRVEGYNGLVVHGPLLATLMLELLRERGPDRRVAAFWFRAVSPVVHTEAFEACAALGRREEDEGLSGDGLGADLWVRALDPRVPGGGRLAMEGRAVFAKERAGRRGG